MSEFYTFFFTICLFISAALADTASPCKFNDEPCLERFLYIVADKIFTGDSSLNIEAGDPLFFNRIDGKLPGLNYTLLDTSVIGLKRCKIANVKVNLKALNMRFDAECPKNTKMFGKYTVDGRFFSWQIVGNGDYDFLAGSLKINVDMGLEKVERNNQVQLKIKDFKTKVEQTSPFKTEFKNLFNGHKKLSDVVHKFAHDNWKITSEFVQQPLIFTVFKRLVGNANKFLSSKYFSL